MGAAAAAGVGHLVLATVVAELAVAVVLEVLAAVVGLLVGVALVVVVAMVVVVVALVVVGQLAAAEPVGQLDQRMAMRSTLYILSSCHSCPLCDGNFVADIDSISPKAVGVLTFSCRLQLSSHRRYRRLTSRRRCRRCRFVAMP